jgi:isopentenyl-diphosphate delta-isomerase
MEKILLVDESDKPKGYIEKIKAHEKGGILHRAFSIFIFNSKGQMLLQKRAKTKYHFGGLWTNSCCSHQRDSDRELINAAHRRLKEEFGFDTEIRELFSFIYQADFSNGLSEKEFDHIYVGKFDGTPAPNPEEIEEFAWMDLAELKNDLKKNTDKYTPWFKIALEKENSLLLDKKRLNI